MDDLKIFIQNEIMELAFVKVQFGDSLIKSGVLSSILVVDLIVAIEGKIGKTIPQYLIREEHFDSIDLIVETLKKF